MKKQWFTVKQIRPQLWAIAEFQHVEKTVMYFVLGKSHTLLFDSGMGMRSIHRVIRKITKLPIAIILTHSHWDHVGGILSSDTVYQWKDFTDGQEIVVDDMVISVIHTPGHTPDSVCYFIKGRNWLFTGDTLYPGPLYAHLPESNIHDYANSLQKLCAIVNDQTLIFPGHNAIQCDYPLLVRASQLMGQIEEKQLQGDGFSILLPESLL